MTKKKIVNLLVGILICFVISMFLCFQYFGYTSKFLDVQLQQDIKEKFHLNLSDENWRYKVYDKKTLINAKPTFYHIYNPFVSLYNEFNDFIVSIDVTEGEEIFETSLPAMIFKDKRDQVMIEKQISYKNIKMNIQILEKESNDNIVLTYCSKCRIVINYNNYLYHFVFEPSKPISYSTNSTNIHKEELDIYLNFIDIVLFNN